MIHGNSLLVIGHRGASGHAPENTMQAFQVAAGMHADMVECDVHLTRDNEVVVIHDDMLERTTNGSGSVRTYSYNELQQFDAGNGAHIPLLKELLDLCAEKNIGCDIELKGSGTALPVARLLRSYLDQRILTGEQIIVTSFDHQQLADFKMYMPDVMLAMLYYEESPNISDIWTKYIGINYQMITKDFIDALHAQNIRIMVYTVNHVDDIECMISYGVDGIISDFPDRVHLVLQQ